MIPEDFEEWWDTQTDLPLHHVTAETWARKGWEARDAEVQRLRRILKACGWTDLQRVVRGWTTGP